MTNSGGDVLSSPPNGGRVDLRDTHPNLYKGLTKHAVIIAALALNFLFAHPAFEPFGLGKMPTGYVFMAVALLDLYALRINQNLRLIRWATAISVGVVFFGFGALNAAAAYIGGETSYQNPILYLGFAWELWSWLVEPWINPATHKNGVG